MHFCNDQETWSSDQRYAHGFCLSLFGRQNLDSFSLVVVNLLEDLQTLVKSLAVLKAFVQLDRQLQGLNLTKGHNWFFLLLFDKLLLVHNLEFHWNEFSKLVAVGAAESESKLDGLASH